MELEIFVSGKMKLRIQKFLDNCERGFRVISYHLGIHFLNYYLFQIAAANKKTKDNTRHGKAKLEVTK